VPHRTLFLTSWIWYDKPVMFLLHHNNHFPIFSLLPQHLSNLVRVSSKSVMPKTKQGVRRLFHLLSTPTSLYLVHSLWSPILHEVQNHWICLKIPCMYLFPSDAEWFQIISRSEKTVRACRRCRSTSCPGNSDVSNCKMECKVACKNCGRFTGCRGVDNGRKCSGT